MAAKKKRFPVASRLERAVSDIANAASVAATGSEIGVLELAVEDELNPRTVRKRRVKTAFADKDSGQDSGEETAQSRQKDSCLAARSAKSKGGSQQSRDLGLAGARNSNR